MKLFYSTVIENLNIKSLCFLIFTLFCFTKGFSEEKPRNNSNASIILSGQIIDSQNNEKLAGVRISCGNESKIIHSNLDGTFFIFINEKNVSENAKIEFSQIGYNAKSISLKELKVNNFSLTINLSSEQTSM